MSKSTTKHIVISEPDEDLLKRGLEGRELSPHLVSFLRKLIKTKKWTRKINIPSSRNDLAAVLVFTSELKEAGLEIFSELHVFLNGRIMIEKWQVVGEREQIAALPTGAFTSVEIEKVRFDGNRIDIDIRVFVSPGRSKTLVKTFDFTGDGPMVRVAPHPLLESESSGEDWIEFSSCGSTVA